MDIIQIGLLVIIILLLLTDHKYIKKSTSGLGESKKKLILDSSGIIDGRILQIVKTGFIDYKLIIPQFIINELQLIADGHDAHKRERARFGLDIVRELQEVAPKVIIDRTQFNNIDKTDDKLVALGKKIKGLLYTTDFNLGKVAAVEGVDVLNVNELSQQLRPVALPGEKVTVKILQKGSSPGQGVGYLDDGTMIVVDGALRSIGKHVTVTVERMHQTVAGKMVFGKIDQQKTIR
jgi:uncharacterized protein YacL